MRSSLLQKHEERDALKLYKKGLSASGVAKELGIRYSTIREFLREKGVLRPHGGKKTANRKKIMKIAKKYKSTSNKYHNGVVLIAKEAGVHVSTVRRVLREEEGP